MSVLGNLSSNLVQNIGIGINEILHGEVVSNDVEDSNQYLDKLAFGVILVLSILMLAVLFYIIRVLIKIYRKQLYFRFIGIKSIFKLTLSFVFMLGLSYFIYLIPSLLLNGYSWGTVFVWSPKSVQVALYSLYIVGWFTYIFFMLKILFKKEYNNAYEK